MVLVEDDVKMVVPSADLSVMSVCVLLSIRDRLCRGIPLCALEEAIWTRMCCRSEQTHAWLLSGMF
jgi:hypothetical protein